MKCSNKELTHQRIEKYIDGFFSKCLKQVDTIQYMLQTLAQKFELVYEYHGLFFKSNFEPTDEEYHLLSDREIMISIFGLAYTDEEGLTIILSFEELYEYLHKRIDHMGFPFLDSIKCKAGLKKLKLALGIF